jgi:cyclin H
LAWGDGVTEERLRNVEKRARDAHGKAREYLKTSTLLTDVYFHFTPSQIMMAALMIADKALTEWYIKCKFPAATRELQKKVFDTIERCSNLLTEIEPSLEPVAAERKELQALAKKIKKCQNPENIDLVGLQRAKREGKGDNDKKIISEAKKTKRRQSAKEGDDLFGPEIKKS